MDNLLKLIIIVSLILCVHSRPLGPHPVANTELVPTNDVNNGTAAATLPAGNSTLAAAGPAVLADGTAAGAPLPEPVTASPSSPVVEDAAAAAASSAEPPRRLTKKTSPRRPKGRLLAKKPGRPGKKGKSGRRMLLL